MSLGYTYTSMRVLTDTDNSFAFQPRHLLKLSTDYQLPGRWNRWRIGGGLYVSSSFLARSGDTVTRQAGYATADLRVAYQLDKQASATLSVTNVFNRYYYETVSGVSNWNYPGAPRRAMLMLRYSL